MRVCLWLKLFWLRTERPLRSARCFGRLRVHSPAIGPAPVDFFGFWNFLRDHRLVHKACRTEDLVEDQFTTCPAMPKRVPRRVPPQPTPSRLGRLLPSGLVGRRF